MVNYTSQVICGKQTICHNPTQERRNFPSTASGACKFYQNAREKEDSGICIQTVKKSPRRTPWSSITSSIIHHFLLGIRDFCWVPVTSPPTGDSFLLNL